MPDERSPDVPDFVHRIGDGRLLILVNRIIYSLAAILRTCYAFTDRCYLHLVPEGEDVIQVYLKAKSSASHLENIAHEFCNDLIDQQLRVTLAAETAKVRELIVAQAFAEGNLLRDPAEDADPNDDPLRVAEPD